MELSNPTDDDDPVVSVYEVYLNPPIPKSRSLLVLQQPNQRTTLTSASFRAPPSQMRLKPKSGMVELDVPTNIIDSYDREKGMRWGRVLQESLLAKSGGSHGLAGGFGVGAPQQRGRRREDSEISDWSEEVKHGRVLHTQTLGGHSPNARFVKHMIGVFQDEKLYFTPTESVIHIRPQLHHVDAVTQQDKLAAASQTSTSIGATGASAVNPPPARAIHMTIKTADGGTVTTETMTDRLRAVQNEAWRRLLYTDENDDEAWDIYAETLLPLPRGGGSSQDHGKEGREHFLNPLSEEQAYSLRTGWGDEKLLEAVSGLTGQEETVMKTEDQMEASTPMFDKVHGAQGSEPVVASQTKKGKGKDVGPARRGRGKSSALGSSMAMEVD